MDRIVYDRMAEYDASHWWYRGRRMIIDKVIANQLTPKDGAAILEIGCGTGHNLAMLQQYGTVDAVEIDPAARELATQRLGKAVLNAPLPELDGIKRNHYAIAGLFDVLEHVEDDVAALRSIGDCLAPGGKLLLTVPAFPWMWSAHDVVNHHQRRYTKATLAKAIAHSGLKLERMSWFNSLLFPVAALARIWGKATGKTDSDDNQPGAAANRILERIFSSERHLLWRIPMPPGVSLIAIVSRD